MRRAAAGFWQLLVGHDVFISYSRSDAKPYARALRTKLGSCDVFLDEQRLEPGSLLPRRVRRAVRGSSVVAVLVTPGAVAKSDWILEEVKHAGAGMVPRVVIPIAFEPFASGRLPAPFEFLNDRVSIDESGANLATGRPREDISAGIERSLGAVRVRTRRALALLAVAVLLGGLLWVWYAREQSAACALEVQRALAEVDRAVGRDRYDLAELAIARAVRCEAARRALAERYALVRSRRQLVPVGLVELEPGERIEWVGERGGAVQVLTRSDRRLHTRSLGAATTDVPTCVEPTIASCRRGPPALLCGDELVTLGTDERPPLRFGLPGNVRSVACDDDGVRALVGDTSGQLRVYRGSYGAPLSPESAGLRADSWIDGGLCDGAASLFGARLEHGALFVVLGGELPQGGEGAVVRRIDRGRIAIASLVATPQCHRFFIEYQSMAVGEGEPFGAVTRPAWMMLDWDGLVRERELPLATRSIWPVPDTTGFYAVYLTTTGELGMLPFTDALVREIEPVVVATGVNALAVAQTSPDGPRGIRTFGLEGLDLVVRDRGAVVARYRHGIEDASAIEVDASGELVVVEGSSTARIWRRAAPAGSRSIPDPRELAATLGLEQGAVVP